MSSENKRIHRKSANPYILFILSFVFVILVGSLLLYMPFCASSTSQVTWSHWGNFDYYINCFFVAVSSTCVTGLNGFADGLAGTFNFAGQLIVLIMIQIGGLGFITILTFILTLFRSKLQFKNRYVLAQAVNATRVADVVKFVRNVVIVALVFETIGTLLGLPVFLKIFEDDPSKGIWNAIFISVSAFNNAGFDILGSNSLMSPVITNLLADPSTQWMYYYLLSYLMILIICGGISFLVIFDLAGRLRRRKKNEIHTFTKIVLATTAFLLISGYVLLLLTDGTRGVLSPFDALFQTVTLRTAGFANVDQSQLSLPGKAICCLFMFIGGSPLSTAGGIKTTTAFVIVLSLYCHLRGKQVVAFKRTYSSNTILKAMSLLVLGIFSTIVAMVAIAGFEGGNEAITMEDIFFEVFSAFGTVGLSTGITPVLHTGSKIILCVLMFLGRLGPITFFQVFSTNMNKEGSLHFKYIEEETLVG